MDQFNHRYALLGEAMGLLKKDSDRIDLLVAEKILKVVRDEDAPHNKSSLVAELVLNEGCLNVVEAMYAGMRIQKALSVIYSSAPLAPVLMQVLKDKTITAPKDVVMIMNKDF